MEFRDVVRRRRMVRRHLSDPVDPEVVDRILDVARRAPSAGFAQGPRFVVVTEAATRHRIARLAGEERYVAAGFEPWISSAPVLVVVAVDRGAYLRRYRESDKGGAEGPLAREEDWTVPYWWVDAGAALMLLLLAAVDEGLGAGFLGGHAIPGLGDLLGVPPEVEIVGVVTLGRAAPDRRSGSLERGRLPLDRVVHRERWQAT